VLQKSQLPVAGQLHPALDKRSAACLSPASAHDRFPGEIHDGVTSFQSLLEAVSARTERYGLDLGAEKASGPFFGAYQGDQLVALAAKNGNQRSADEAGGASDEYAHRESFLNASGQFHLRYQACASAQSSIRSPPAALASHSNPPHKRRARAQYPNAHRGRPRPCAHKSVRESCAGTRMRAHGPRSHHVQAQLRAQLSRLRIKIEKNLHVVGDETDSERSPHPNCRPAFDFGKAIENVWLQPGLRSWTASALVYQPPFFRPNFSATSRPVSLSCFFVVTALRHRQWYAVRRIDKVRRLAPLLWNRCSACCKRSVTASTNPGWLWNARIYPPPGRPRRLLLAPVLCLPGTAGNSSTNCKRTSQKPAHGGLRSPSSDAACRRQGMPVAVSPIDGQARPILRQFDFKSGDEPPILVVDRLLPPNW